MVVGLLWLIRSLSCIAVGEGITTFQGVSMKSLLALTLSLLFFAPAAHTKVTTDFSDEMIVDHLQQSSEFKAYKKEHKALFKKALYVGAEIARVRMPNGMLSYEVNLHYQTEVTYRGKKHMVPMAIPAHTEIERYVVPGRRIVASKLADPTFQKPLVPVLAH